MVNTQGIDKRQVLAALYNASKTQGSGWFHFTPEDMTADEAGKLLESETYFDYLKGRVMKVNLENDSEFEEWLYDRDNGVGAAQRAIDSIVTMEAVGTPWAEEYRGTGRLTGQVAAEPTLTDTGDVAPGWTFVGHMTEKDFLAQAEKEQIGR